MMTDNEISLALTRYAQRSGNEAQDFKAVLFDMDGVLYDSMPGHCRAWKAMCDAQGIEAQEDEFFQYEGRTGADTIDILFRRQYGHGVDADTARDLYAIKSANFKSYGPARIMPGAKEAIDNCLSAGVKTCLVTGSGQASILERLESDYPAAFPAGRRVTAYDVEHGKPDPEPYLKGMAKCDVSPWQAIAVDNAPLGVISAAKSGAFTIGVLTGPLPEHALEDAGADIVVASMTECALILKHLLA